MIEKVTIKTAIDSGKKYQDKSIIQIELADGRKGSSFDSDAIKWTGEMELEVKPGKEYNGVMQYYFSIPKPVGKFPMKDYTFDKRKASLECAIETAKAGIVKVSSEDILKVAEAYFTYLNKK